MKKIVLTGGGTAGHVSPNLALIPHLLAQGYDISYIGTEKGIEREMISKVPEVHYYAVKSGKLRRYFSWQNFTDPFRVIAGAFQSAHLMGKIRPNVVFSKGGFVSVPVVFGAWLHHIPVVCHESDLTPGLANKLCKPFARRFATTFPECAQALGAKAEMTGTPLRPELFHGSRAKGLSLLGFTGTKPVLLMMGGSLGAQSVNKVLREALPELLPQFDVCHICGKGNLDASLNDTVGYRQLEFVDKDLPDLLATADLGYNFFASLVPEINDGISVRGVLAPLLFSDHLLGDFWSRERFLNAFVAAAYAVGALAAANVVCAASRIMRGKITAEEE